MKKKQTNSKWLPPKGYERFFSAASDEEFKRKHPVGYGFLATLGIMALLAPALLFCILAAPTDSSWIMLGFLGGFVFGVGLFNLVAIMIKQYLGHLVSIVSFAVGGALMLVAWLLCHQ